MAILFLDFDGVLHTKGEMPFHRTEVLQYLIDIVPNIEIVITSSWRESFNIDGIKEFFPDNIANIIIGVTPIIPDHIIEVNGKMIPDCRGIRQQEIEKYLNDNSIKCKWAILDDNRYLFTDIDNLVIVDGITKLDMERVREILM